MRYKNIMILVISIVCLLAISSVSASDNITDDNLVDDANSLSADNESSLADDYDDFNYVDDYYEYEHDYYWNSDEYSSSDYEEDYHNQWVYANSITTYYNSGEKYTFNVADTWIVTIDDGDSIINSKFCTGYGEDGDDFSYDLKDLSPGTYYVKFYDDYYGRLVQTQTIKILKSSSKLTVKSFSATAGSNYVLKAYLKDKHSGRNYNGCVIIFKINGKSYNANVKNGIGSLKIKVPKTIKKFTCSATFKGNKNVSGTSSTFKMTVNPVPIKTKVIAPSIVLKANQNKKFKIKVKTTNGNPIKNLKLTVEISGTVFTVKTDSNGVAYVSLKNLAHKTYKIQISSDNSKYKVSKTSKVTIKPVSSGKSVTLKVIYSNNFILKRLSNGDVISTTYEKFSGRQFDPGVYALASHGEGLITAKHIKLVKSKVWFKNSQGKIITKSSSKVHYNWYIKVGLVKGYTPYKAQIWYKNR